MKKDYIAKLVPFVVFLLFNLLTAFSIPTDFGSQSKDFWLLIMVVINLFLAMNITFLSYFVWIIKGYKVEQSAYYATFAGILGSFFMIIGLSRYEQSFGVGMYLCLFSMMGGLITVVVSGWLFLATTIVSKREVIVTSE